MVSNEYAKALFELATEYDILDTISENLTAFCISLKENKDYMKVLTYPEISNKEKKKSIDKVYRSFDKLFIRFLYVLVDNDEMKNVFDIERGYNEIVDELNNIKSIDVYSKESLDDNQLAIVHDALKGYFKGKKIILNNIVDPSLIGGITIMSNNQLLDLSFNSKLESLKKAL